MSDTENSSTFSSRNPQAYEALNRFAKGGMAGLVGSLIMQPLQVIKTSMQVSPIDKTKTAVIEQDPKKALKAAKTNAPNVFSSEDVNLIKKGRARHGMTFSQATTLIYHREGMQGFMRGFLPSILKGTLNSGTYFSSLYYNE